MRYCFFIVVLVLSSCTNPSTSENTSDTTTDTSAAVTPAPAAAVKSGLTTSTGLSTYVGFANYFEETGEFYVSLYYTDSEHDINTNALDSIVFTDGDGYVRKTVPMETARKHFRLDNLETLRFYNVDHQHLATASLRRVEYVEAWISFQYVAVYKINHDNAAADGPYYAVSDNIGDAIQKNFSTQAVDDTSLNARILRSLNLNTADMWVMTHRRVEPSGVIYSTANFGNQAYLVETINDKSTIMETMTDGYHFGIVLPVPVMQKGKPMLLVTFHQSEGDDTGDYAAAFNGTKYEGLDGGRVVPD